MQAETKSYGSLPPQADPAQHAAASRLPSFAAFVAASSSVDLHTLFVGCVPLEADSNTTVATSAASTAMRCSAQDRHRKCVLCKVPWQSS